MKTRIKIAIQAAKEAGVIIKDNFRGNFSISTKKNDRDLITSADLASDKTIITLIKKHFSSDSILSEESCKSNLSESNLWFIDPIDGTMNFVSGLPLSCISIAYGEREIIKLGVVYHPFVDELYVAEKGKGAYLIKGDMSRKIRLSVSTAKLLGEALVSFDYSSVDDYRKSINQVTRNLPMKVRGMRVLGAAALEFAWVGAGYLAAYLSRGAHPWDVAAGALIVEESGGVVTDWQGKPWQLGSGNFLASNGRIHESFIKEILS